MCVCVRVCGYVATYHHVERIHRLEASDQGCYKGVSRDFGEDVALVPDMLDLLETDDYKERISSSTPLAVLGSCVPSTLRRTFKAKILFSSPGLAFFNRTSQTRAKVPGAESANGWQCGRTCRHANRFRAS